MITSPFSNKNPDKLRDLSKEDILAQLERYFHKSPPTDIVDSSYSIWRCQETGFEFCDPPLPGNAAFYEWISSFASYYPDYRWEYGEVARIIREQKPSTNDLKILDVGCGKGDFLLELDFLPAADKYALDMNESAIRACREHGFHAYCGTVENAIGSGFLKPGEFPVVTSFHCLEHVPQPVEFVRELLRATAPGGSLFLSTPYSPMSFETEWFDIMNHPPHHMGRWNLAAYRRLADILEVKLRHFSPPSSPLRQALQLFKLKIYGPNVSIRRSTLIKDLLLYLPMFLAEWKQLSQRTKHHENGGSDVILVELTAP
jgi:SAM-dependent methyltransferase